MPPICRSFFYISPTQLETVRKTLKLKGDGTFKYTPKVYRQISRLLGCVQKTKCVPVAIVIMLKKSKKLYKKIFNKIKEIVGERGLKATKIHFDYEVG